MSGEGSSLSSLRQGGGSILSVLGERNFRWLWIGEGVSTLGSQFYLIALPWLVLKLTDSTFTLGTVMGLAGVPRALLLLLGGALTDRFSPRLLMLASNLARMVLVSLLTILVLGGHVDLWILYVLAFLFGLADAFFYPGLFAIMPQILETRFLHFGNAIVQGVSQLSIAIGPVLAGLLIALASGETVNGQSVARDATLPTGTSALHVNGIALAFAFNAFTFLVSVATLHQIRVKRPATTAAEAGQEHSMLSSIKDGVIYVWRDPSLRAVFVIAAALSLLGEGPVLVGVPALADKMLAEGATAFGIIMSCFGLGSVMGIAVAGLQPARAMRRLGLLLPVASGLMGLGMLTFSLATTTLPIALAALVMGASLGYTIVVLTTWLQERTPEHLMGRMMSLLVLAVVGMIPFSMALAGILLERDMHLLFLDAGLLILLVAAWAARTPALRALSDPGRKPS